MRSESDAIAKSVRIAARAAGATKEEAAAEAEAAPSVPASCSTQLDTAIVQGLKYLLGSAVETGASSMIYSIFSFLTVLYSAISSSDFPLGFGFGIPFGLCFLSFV